MNFDEGAMPIKQILVKTKEYVVLPEVKRVFQNFQWYSKKTACLKQL